MSAITDVLRIFPESMRDTALIRIFGLVKIPMLFWIRPKVLVCDEKITTVIIPLSRRTKNHQNSMYFGALAAGADCAGGLACMKQIETSGRNISFIFKDFKAEFLKRPEADTHFTCRDGDKITSLLQRAIETKEREDETVEIVATCPDKMGDEPVAKFLLTISLKDKSQ